MARRVNGRADHRRAGEPAHDRAGRAHAGRHHCAGLCRAAARSAGCALGIFAGSPCQLRHRAHTRDAVDAVRQPPFRCRCAVRAHIERRRPVGGAHLHATIRGMGRAGLHRARTARAPVRSPRHTAHAADARDRGAAGANHSDRRGAPMRALSASRRPRVGADLPRMGLAAAAALSIALWFAVENLARRPIDALFVEMLAAAHTMQVASGVLLAHREARGLLPPSEADPNRTGMIGPEYSAITTTLGDPASKRTTTNPDFAAAVTRLIASLDLRRGTPIVIVLSGSFVGGNVAAIAAAEALALRPVVIVSLSASMWGANDPAFNWLDMAALRRERGVIRARTTAAVLGGEGSVGGGMDPAGIAALRASAARDGVPLVEARPFA